MYRCRGSGWDDLQPGPPDRLEGPRADPAGQQQSVLRRVLPAEEGRLQGPDNVWTRAGPRYEWRRAPELLRQRCAVHAPAPPCRPAWIDRRRTRRPHHPRCRARVCGPGDSWPDDLAADDDGARPDARGPKLASTTSVRHQDLAIASLKEEVGVAAGQESRGHGGPWPGAEALLVARQDPRIAHRCADGRQRSRERVERAAAECGSDPSPIGERRGRPRAEDVQIAARELETSVSGVDPGCRHGPHRRLSGAVPPDHYGARCGGVAQSVRVYAEPASRLAIAHPPAGEERVHTCGKTLGACPAHGVLGKPREREDREVPRGYDVGAEPRSPKLDARTVFPRGRLGPAHPRVDRKKRRARHAVLPAGPGRAAQRRCAARGPLVKEPDLSSVGEDLRPREAEPAGGCHLTIIFGQRVTPATREVGEPTWTKARSSATSPRGIRMPTP